MGKLKGQSVRSKHFSARTKTRIQPFLLTDLRLCRMVFTQRDHMGRRLPTKVPAMPSVLKPNEHDTDRQRVQLREDKYRSKQQIYHDKRHQARALPALTTGEQIWVRDQNREGQIIGATKLPRSYLVKTDMSTLRRNRSALVETSRSSTVRGPNNSKGFYPRARKSTG